MECPPSVAPFRFGLMTHCIIMSLHFIMQTPLTDGWGITNNGTHLIVGDSSHVLSFIDPKTMEIVEQVPVTGTASVL